MSGPGTDTVVLVEQQARAASDVDGHDLTGLDSRPAR